MSLFEAVLLGALREALEESEGQRGSTTTTVTRTDRYSFHNRHSTFITLSANKKTAARQLPMLRYDQGIVFSDQPLKDNEVFEIRIDQMVGRWNGSVEIGVTALNPLIIPKLPDTMTNVAVGTWMLSGHQVTKDGSAIKQGYGSDIGCLKVGDLLGVTRTDNGALHFFINKKHQGLAATNVPAGVFAVVDIYGKCSQVSIISPNAPPPSSHPLARLMSASGVVSSADDEMTRYSQQREWIRQCRRIPFQLWLLKELSEARSDDEKREIFLFVNSFGHRLEHKTATCDGCNLNIPIIGQIRYRCLECSDLDLCSNCFQNKKTPKTHELNHKIAEMRCRCDGTDCGGLITGTKFHCLVCNDFDLCLGCQKTENWPGRHQRSHRMEKSSTLVTPKSGSTDGASGGDHTMADDGFCTGPHNFSTGECYVCKRCGKCTGFGANCIESRKPNRYPGGLCGCGYGETGCLKCKICKDCAGKRRASPSTKRDKPRPATAVSTKCEYREKCQRFLDSLDIPDIYFEKTPSYNICFCKNCHKKRGDKECYPRGKPPKNYALPVGWSRFALVAPPQAKVLNAFSEWHVAFHGTVPKSVRAILDNAGLLIAGDVAVGGRKLKEGEGHYNDNWKPSEFDTKKIFVSPSIKYAGCPVYAKKQSFKDPVTGETVSGKVAMQVLIRPECYEVGKTTVERAEPFDRNFNDNELEWSTKERRGVMITGLLVKIE